MQLLNFKALLFFALAFFSVSFSFAHNAPITPDAPNSCPPAPAPTNLTVTGVSATTISLSWSAPGAPFHQISVIDLVTSTTYPPIFGTGEQATITGLQPGHAHVITVRSSKCEEGEYGDEAKTETTTGIIIIDMVGGFQEGGCVPTTPFIGTQHEICVKKSATSASPYNNESNVRITFNQSGCTFGFAYTETIGSVPKLSLVPVSSNGLFNFQQINNGLVKCTYGSTEPVELLQIIPVEMTDTEAKAFIKFSDAFRTFGASYKFCSGCRERDVKRSMDSDLSVDASVPAIAIPNPFTDHTRIQYSLTGPTLVSIQLYDAIGRLVHTVQPATSLEAGEYTTTVEGSGLPKGSYFAVLQKGDQRQVISLVKQE